MVNFGSNLRTTRRDFFSRLGDGVHGAALAWLLQGGSSGFAGPRPGTAPGRLESAGSPP